MNPARLLVPCLLAMLLGAPRAGAQTRSQSFELRPGWNALWIEVDPPDRAPAKVFAGLPVTSVWTWSERVSATDFIQNPGDAGWNRAQWLSYFPEGSPESLLSSLRSILPQRAYLVRLAGTNTVAWSLAGRPTLRPPAWAADRFNLRGFPVDEAVSPTFQQFFRASPAHYSTATSRLEPVYRLAADGRWLAVQDGDRMRRGEAYWVYSRGASEFVAPFGLHLTSGEGLGFGGGLHRIDLTLRNGHPVAKGIRIEPAGPHASPLLLESAPEAGAPPVLRPLGTHDQPVAAGSAQKLRLALDRAQLGASPATDPESGFHAALLSVSDGEGTRYFVGVTADASSSGEYTGLWTGSITITNVASTLDPANPAGPVGLGFPLRLLLHVDSAGQVQLLREVTLVTARTNAGSTLTPSAELVTDPSRLLAYSAADLRSGAVRGRRLTSPHFDFARGPGQFSLALEGTVGPSNVISGTLSLPGDSPGNPFRHRYHPDHGTNAYAVTRDIRLELGPALIGDDSQLDGTYSETLTGLHKLPLQVSGSLVLRRVSTVGVLNVAATP